MLESGAPAAGGRPCPIAVSFQCSKWSPRFRVWGTDPVGAVWQQVVTERIAAAPHHPPTINLGGIVSHPRPLAEPVMSSGIPGAAEQPERAVDSPGATARLAWQPVAWVPASLPSPRSLVAARAVRVPPRLAVGPAVQVHVLGLPERLQALDAQLAGVAGHLNPAERPGVVVGQWVVEPDS